MKGQGAETNDVASASEKKVAPKWNNFGGFGSCSGRNAHSVQTKQSGTLNTQSWSVRRYRTHGKKRQE